MFFDSWTGMGRMAVAAALAYAGVIGLLRVSGKRTLAKLNAFDLVVTIALGSLLATVVVSRSVPLAEGLAAIGLLVGLHLLAARAALLFRPLRRVLKSTPAALIERGQLLPERLAVERVGIEELAEAVRKEGFGSFEQVDSVVLETDGTFSVISDAGDASALRDVRGTAGSDVGRTTSPHGDGATRR